jgi:hypothetical protein
MRQRIVGTLLWLFFVPIAGTMKLLWAILRKVVWMRQPSLVVLVGLLVVLGSTPAVAAQLQTEGIETLWSSFLSWGLPFIGVVILVLGSRSRSCRRLRRVLRRRGWFVGSPVSEWEL